MNVHNPAHDSFPSISLGGIEWFILDQNGSELFLLSKYIVEKRWYHDCWEEVYWANSFIRHYLNNDFIKIFSPQEQNRILNTKLQNANNPWFGTEDGPDTKDRIFLLSIEEVLKFFGSAMATNPPKGSDKWTYSDSYNPLRMAMYEQDPYWWRLRSPGYYRKTSASVAKDGKIYIRGNGVYGSSTDKGGIRPALRYRI